MTRSKGVPLRMAYCDVCHRKQPARDGTFRKHPRYGTTTVCPNSGKAAP